MRVNTVTVTPQIAEEWLSRNAHNRSLNRFHVKDLAGAMARGEWRLTHQGLAFAADGALIDGQHRLAAVVLSGATIVTLVTVNAPANTMPAVDVGRKRTAADTLTLKGETNTTTLAGAVRVLQGYAAGAISLPRSYKLTNEQTAQLVDEFGDELRQAVYTSNGLRAILTPSVGAATAYLARKSGPGLSDAFLDGLATGAGLEATDPRLALRALMANAIRLRRARPAMWQLAVAAKTWNAYVVTKPIGTLRWADEVLPTFALTTKGL